MVGPAVRKREGAARIFGPRWAAVGTAGCSIVSAFDRKMVRYTLMSARQTRSFGRNCAISPTRGSVSDIVGCSSCCGRRASPRASNRRIYRLFIAKKASRCASGGLGGAPWGRGRRSWVEPASASINGAVHVRARSCRHMGMSIAHVAQPQRWGDRHSPPGMRSVRLACAWAWRPRYLDVGCHGAALDHGVGVPLGQRCRR